MGVFCWESDLVSREYSNYLWVHSPTGSMGIATYYWWKRNKKRRLLIWIKTATATSTPFPTIPKIVLKDNGLHCICLSYDFYCAHDYSVFRLSFTIGKRSDDSKIQTWKNDAALSDTN